MLFSPSLFWRLPGAERGNSSAISLISHTSMKRIRKYSESALIQDSRSKCIASNSEWNSPF